MIRLERIIGSTRLGWVSLIGILLVPILMAAVLLAATWDSPSRWEGVQAAIVNNDRPVHLNGHLVPLGRQLAGGLVDPDADRDGSVENFDWVISNSADAAAGLADGRYAAVITIPRNFSANATSFSANDGDKAEHATIDVQTSKVSGVTDPSVADAITASAVSALNGELTRRYLQNLYLGFNQTHQGMQRSTNRAADLAGGASELRRGIGRSAVAGDTLAAGIDRLSNGADDLADGLQRADSSAGQLAAGAGELAQGVKQTHDGAAQLDQGVAELDRRASTYREGARTFAAGLDDYIDGVDAYIGAVEPIAERARDIAGAVEQFLADVNRTAGNIAQYLAAIRHYTGGVGDYVDGVDRYARDVAQFVDSIGPTAERVADGVTNEAAAQCAQQQLNAQQCQIFTAGVRAGAERTAGGVKQALLGTGRSGQTTRGEQVVASSKSITAAGEQLTGSGGEITNSIEQLSIDAHQLRNAGEQLPAALMSLPTRIKNGADKLVRSGDQLSIAGRRVTDGADRLLSGATQLDGGISALHDGSSRLADGTGQLADRADQLGSGVAGLSGGLGRLADGGDQVAGGANQSAAGAHRLSNGLGRLNDGGRQLAAGARRLADGLQRDADRIPTFSTPDRTRLADVASQPISSNRPDQQFTNESTSTLLMALAVWIGGLVTYLVVRAIGSDAFGSSKTSAWLALEGVLPAVVIGAIQAVLLSGILTVLFELSIARFAGLLAFGLLAAATFATLNYALVAWFGGTGRLISLTMAVLAAAEAITGAVPDLFTTARPYLPITPALDGIRMIVSQGPSAGPQIAGLLGWLAIGTAGSIIAVARRRVADPVTLLAPAQRPRRWVGSSSAQ